MNIIKAVIGTTAVITCCLGNEMPANAQYYGGGYGGPSFVTPTPGGGATITGGGRPATIITPTPGGGASIYGGGYSSPTHISPNGGGGYTIF